jgi:hypothetical protein
MTSSNRGLHRLIRLGIDGTQPSTSARKGFNIVIDPRLAYTVELDESTPSDTSGLMPLIVCEPFDGHARDLIARYTS